MNALTNNGEQVALDALVAEIAALRLYTVASVPAKDGALGGAFVEVANGNGYTTGGIAVDSGDWTYAVVAGKGRMTVAPQTWTASGGPISNVAGIVATNSSGDVICWWERTPATAAAGQTIQTGSLVIG